MVDIYESRLVAISIALVGIGLILNPFYLHPEGGGEPELTYHVSQIDNESMADQALWLSERVLKCPGERQCELEQRVLDEGAVASEYVSSNRQPEYRVVIFDGDTYIPNQQAENGTTLLTLEEVSAMDAIEQLAVPADEQSEEVREAITSGSVTVYGERIEALERYDVFEHDGNYYQHRRFVGSSDHWTANGGLAVARTLLFLIGGGLILTSHRRFQDESS